MQWPAEKIELRAVETLKPYANNPRMHSDAQVQQIARSIREFGFTMPVLVDDQANIIAGHGRVMAAKLMGLTDVPTVTANGWTEAQRRAYMIADNQLTLNGAWNDDLLRGELVALQGADFDLALTGFDETGLAGLLNTLPQGATDPDEAPQAPQVPVSRLGDVWRLGNHQIICGDCNLYEIGMPGSILTDPPYGMKLDTDFSSIKGSLGSIGRKNGTKGNRYEAVIGDDRQFDPSQLMQRFASVKEQFWFGADYYAEFIPNRNAGSWLCWDKRKESQAEAIGSEFELCWSKQKHKRRMLRHDWFGFLSSANGDEARNRVHPTQKPSTLFVDIINQWIKKEHTIVDLFLGSGTTIIAAEMTGRACHALELNPAYVDVSVMRWQNFTEKKATLDADGRTFDEIAAERKKEAA